MIIASSVAVHQYFGMQLRVVGPLGEEQCREWIDRQDHPDEWSVVPIENVGTINEWESILREEQGIVIYDYDGFSDWRQEWPMTRAEFNKRVGACTVGPAHKS